MKSFFFKICRCLDIHELILTGEQLTPDFQLPARFRLDERSCELTGMTEVEVLNLEIVEDSPPVNVFDARKESEKQAPKAPVEKPKRKPTPVAQQIQMTLNFSAPATEIAEPTPEPPVPTPPTSLTSPTSPTLPHRFSVEDRAFLRELRDLQIACYGEGWVRYREEMARATK